MLRNFCKSPLKAQNHGNDGRERVLSPRHLVKTKSKVLKINLKHWAEIKDNYLVIYKSRRSKRISRTVCLQNFDITASSEKAGSPQKANDSYWVKLQFSDKSTYYLHESDRDVFVDLCQTLENLRAGKSAKLQLCSAYGFLTGTAPSNA